MIDHIEVLRSTLLGASRSDKVIHTHQGGLWQLRQPAFGPSALTDVGKAKYDNSIPEE